MDKRDLSRLNALIGLVSSLEHDLGLSELGDQEKRVFLAFSEVAVNGTKVTVSEFSDSPLLAGVSRSSFFRHLGSLCEAGLIIREEYDGAHPTYSLAD